MPERLPVDVVAVALDTEWAHVERFLGSDSQRPSSVFLGDSTEIESALGVHSLPVTFLVQPGGRLQLRFDGARDWSNSRFLRTWIKHAGNE